MLRLDLYRAPAWLDLGHGVRLKLEPLSAALTRISHEGLVHRGG